MIGPTISKRAKPCNHKYRGRHRAATGLSTASGSNQGQRGTYIKRVTSHQRSAPIRKTSHRPRIMTVNDPDETTSVVLAYRASRARRPTAVALPWTGTGLSLLCKDVASQSI